MSQILIVDDHSIVRTGIKVLLEAQLNMSADEADDGRAALKLIKDRKYDLILLDINMPGMDCSQLINAVLSFDPDSNILIFSMNEEELFARHYLKLGVKGFLSKRSSPDEIIYAIRQVLSGKRYISRELAEMLGDQMNGHKNENPFLTLSQRELTVVSYLLKGNKISEIGDLMNLHASTISTYRNRIFEKLNIKSLIDLTELARIHHFSIN
jgi:two-component system invasion response regulator UvrY